MKSKHAMNNDELFLFYRDLGKRRGLRWQKLSIKEKQNNL